MKKKVLAMTLTGMLAVGLLAGCGSSSSSSSDSTGADDTQSSEAEAAGTDAEDSSSDSGEVYNISFTVKLTDEHFERVMAGAQAYADEHDNVNLDIQSPTSATDYEGQINMVETSLNSGAYDALIIAPLESSSISTLVENAGDTVIVACDSDFDSDNKSTFVGTGNTDAAKAGGQAAAEMAIANGVENPTAVILTGVQGDETHDSRMEGYTEGIEEAGGTVLEVQYCDAMADKAANAMEAIIQKYSDGVDIVCTTEDSMAVAAAKTIQDSGSAAFESTIVCGFDGNQPSIEDIQEGTMSMDVAQNGYDMGYKAVEAAVTVLEGGEVDSFIDSGSTIVTADNVDEYVERMISYGVWDE